MTYSGDNIDRQLLSSKQILKLRQIYKDNQEAHVVYTPLILAVTDIFKWTFRQYPFFNVALTDWSTYFSHLNCLTVELWEHASWYLNMKGKYWDPTKVEHGL